jgi:O-antigen/teichoic acid export membrane protein
MRRRAGLPGWGATFDTSVAKGLLVGGVSLWTICVLDMSALSLARVLTVRHTDLGKAGCFVLAYSFIGYLQMLNGALLVPLIPKWSRLARKRRRSKLLREFRNAAVGLLLASGGYGLLLFVLSPLLVPMIYGAEYEPAAALLRVLSVACPLIGAGFASWCLFISQGRVKVVFWANVCWAGTLTVASLLLVPRHGAAGAAIAVVLAYAFWSAAYVVGCIAVLLEISGWEVGAGDRDEIR